MHRFLFPLEGSSILVVNLDEVVNGASNLEWMRETGATKARPRKDAEPDFDLVQPGGVGRRVVQMDILMPSNPAIVLRLVGVEVVQDDVNLDIFGVVNDEIVHEVEKFPAPPPLVVPGLDLTGNHIESSEERRGPMPFVLVTLPGERSSVGQAEPALGPFERLDMRFLVDAQDDRIFGRCQIQSNDVGRLSGKLRIGALAPGAPTLQLYAVFLEYAPHVAR